MAQTKRTFNQARIERDLDDRIVPQGTYRDALNISIDTSEDANVGVIENLKGNQLLANQNILGLSSSSNPNAKVIGSYPHPEKDRIYYFVTGDKSDGIFEHSLKDNTINTIIIDNSTFVASSPTKVILPKFAFSDAAVSASVNNAGIISVTSPIAVVVALTADFNTTVSSNTVRSITAQVTVPSGYSNTGKFLTGTVTATQNAIAAPDVSILDCTNITDAGVTLNAEYATNNGLTAIGFYYKVNTGGSATVTTYSNEHVIRILSGRAANLSNSFDNVLDSDILVKDKDGTTIAASNYIYINNSGNVSTIAFKSSLGTDTQIRAKLPITVSQVSTATTVSNSLTAAQIQSSGTNAAVTPITSPFSKVITGLTANTAYAAVAYATNSVGTTLSSIKYFTTSVASAPPANRPYSNRLYIHPVVGPNTGATGTTFDSGNIGYGPIIKSDNKIYFNVFGFTQSTGTYANQAVIMDQDGVLPPGSSATPGVANRIQVESSVSGPTTQISDGGSPAQLTSVGLTLDTGNSFNPAVGDVKFGGFKSTHALNNIGSDLSGNPVAQTPGLYTITVSGRTDGTVENFTDASLQLQIGSPSGVTTFKSIIQPAFASTGTGTTPFLASGGVSASGFSYNQGNNGVSGRTSFSNIEIGPMEAGNKGVAIIPFQTVAPAVAGGSGLFGSFAGFDATKVAVSISGKTAGTHYDYYVFDQAPVMYGANPGIMIEADPSVLNGSGNSSVTHTVTITYNY